jgi:hypothetical protein
MTSDSNQFPIYHQKLFNEFYQLLILNYSHLGRQL